MNQKLFPKLAAALLAAALFSGCGQREAAPPSPEEVSAAVSRPLTRWPTSKWAAFRPRRT